jgi:electron transport complex protein RnfG
MREMIKLFVVVAVFGAVAGGVLAAVKGATEEKIEMQQLKFVKGPAIDKILKGSSNVPLDDRFKLKFDEKEIVFFIGEFEGKRNTVAFETIGKGYGGDIGVMVAFNLDNDEIVGMDVTTHSESPGLGSRAKTDPSFSDQFKGMTIDGNFSIKAEGGDIDALSGATVTSRGVAATVKESVDIYKGLKDKILEEIST